MFGHETGTIEDLHGAGDGADRAGHGEAGGGPMPPLLRGLHYCRGFNSVKKVEIGG
jgi:hypothetical protein